MQTHGREILQLFQDVFSLLPIATVIDGKILIVHGGISDQTDLDFLSSIERHKVSGINQLWPPGSEKTTFYMLTHSYPPHNNVAVCSVEKSGL